MNQWVTRRNILRPILKKNYELIFEMLWKYFSRQRFCSGNKIFENWALVICVIIWQDLCARIHRWPVNSPHKGPVTRKMFPFGDFIMMNSKAIVECATGHVKHNGLRMWSMDVLIWIEEQNQKLEHILNLPYHKNHTHFLLNYFVCWWSVLPKSFRVT